MKNSEITTPIELALEFKGRGEASDYWLKQLHASNSAFIYEKRSEVGDLHFESFRRKIQLESDVVMQGIKVHRDEKVIYPKSLDFGDWAYCTRDYLKAIAYFEGFNLEGQEKANENPQEPPKIPDNISNENIKSDETRLTDSTITPGVYHQLEFDYW